MQVNAPKLKLENINKYIFFLCLFLYQILFTFQGVDLGDEGAHAAFYQQLFNDPQSVQYNFMFWLSGMLGSASLWVFHGLGLWGLRLAGVLVTTGALLITYRLLRNFILERYLRIGLILVLLMLSNDPKDIYYNNVSALMYVMAASLLFYGIQKNSGWRLLLCGLVVGLNVFNRLPNVLGLGLAALIIYQGITMEKKVVAIAKQVLIFVAGFVVAIIGTFALMKAINHYDYFMNAFKIVVGLGKASSEVKDQDSSYGIGTLIKLFFTNYENSLRYAIYIALFLVIFLGAIHYLKKEAFYKRWFRLVIFFVVFITFLLLIISGKLDHIEMMYCFTGLTLVTSVFILAERNRDVQLLTLTGVFIMLVQPLGSSGGMHAVGQYSMWIIFPIAINYIFQLKYFTNTLQIFRVGPGLSLRFSLSEFTLKILRRYGLVLAMMACLFHAWYYPYFDKEERLHMTAAIDNPKMAGIFTTSERATPINELLHESAKYIHPGDYVLAYSSIPLFHFLTETRPYMRNSWPYLYMSGVFKAELDQAYEKSNFLPVIITQRINTIGDASNWSMAHIPVDPEWDAKNKQRDDYLEHFMSAHGYSEVWSNTIFKIFVPGKK